jgi:hypothetical protein
MRLLFITDFPITGCQYIPNWMNKMATVDAGDHRISTVFAGDLVDRLKEYPEAFCGLHYDQVMLPVTIKEVDDVYQPVRDIVMKMVDDDGRRIIEYEDTH